MKTRIIKRDKWEAKPEQALTSDALSELMLKRFYKKADPTYSQRFNAMEELQKTIMNHVYREGE